MSSSVFTDTEHADCLRAGRKEDVGFQQIEARRARVAELRMRGLTVPTIQKLINSEAEKQGWGVVTERTIERDITAYFQHTTEGDKAQEGLRLSAIAQMERLLELAMRHIHAKDKDAWKTGEYMNAIGTAFKMQLGLLEAKGWTNRGQPVPQKKTYIQVFDENAEAVVANRQLLQPVIDLLDECLGGKAVS